MNVTLCKLVRSINKAQEETSFRSTIVSYNFQVKLNIPITPLAYRIKENYIYQLILWLHDCLCLGVMMLQKRGFVDFLALDSGTFLTRIKLSVL